MLHLPNLVIDASDLCLVWCGSLEFSLAFNYSNVAMMHMIMQYHLLPSMSGVNLVSEILHLRRNVYGLDLRTNVDAVGWFQFPNLP
jgi:hypothetical protein